MKLWKSVAAAAAIATLPFAAADAQTVKIGIVNTYS